MKKSALFSFALILVLAGFSLAGMAQCAIVVHADQPGAKFSKISGKIVTAGKINSYNDFGKKEEVTMTDFKNAKVASGKIETVLPAKSVVLLQLQ